MCDPSQEEYVEDVRLFDFKGEGSLLCHSSYQSTSHFNCYGSSASEFINQHVASECQVQVSLQDGSSVFLNTCETPVDSLCGMDHDPTTPGFQYVNTAGLTQCLAMSVPSVQGLATYKPNGYSVEHQVPTA